MTAGRPRPAALTQAALTRAARTEALTWAALSRACPGRVGRGAAHLGGRVRRLVGGDDAGQRLGPEGADGAGQRRPEGRDHAGELRQPDPPGRVLGQAGRDDLLQAGRDAAQVGLAGDHPVEDGGGAAAAERRVAGRRVGEHAAEREDVARRARLLALGLLGRHVAGGPDHHPGRGQLGALERAGDAEVDHVRPVGRQQHVAGLEVPVHQAAAVHRAQRVGQAGREPPDGVLGQRAVPADHVGQRRAGNVGGGQPGRVVVDPRADHRRGVHAADQAGRRDLLAEPAQELGIAGQLRVHDLDRDRPAAGGEAEVDAAHAARAEAGAERELPDHPRIVRGKRFHLYSYAAEPPWPPWPLRPLSRQIPELSASTQRLPGLPARSNPCGQSGPGAASRGA